MHTTKTVPDFNQVQNGVTWIGGPTHELQRQHIPGYQGHIPGLLAENVYGKNFARVTSECINNRNEKGIDHSTVTIISFRIRVTLLPTSNNSMGLIIEKHSLLTQLNPY